MDKSALDNPDLYVKHSKEKMEEGSHGIPVLVLYQILLLPEQ